MRNTRYEAYMGNRISKEEAKKRISRVVAEEFSEVERYVLIASYLQEMNITDIALERGVHKSSVCRALHRAEQKLKRFLKY